MTKSLPKLTGDNISTLGELLRLRSLHEPEKRIYTFLVDGNVDAVHYTLGEIEYQSRRIGGLLQKLLTVGDRALLLYPPGLDYIASFFGCQFAGVVAVPVYPPDPLRLTRTLPRLKEILKDAQPSVVLTTSNILLLAKQLFIDIPDFQSVHWVTTDNIPDDLADEWHEPTINSSALALLQYTSGSTSAPKGVMLTHGNLMHNSACIQECFKYSSNSLGVIWLPPYHDMGLIGGILQPIYGSFPVILMSPMDLLRNPYLWLQAISRYRATISGGPNFAYDLCTRKISPEQRTTLDLSNWEIAFTGAEPVRSETIERFTQAFKSCGFKRESFHPCYGLAEATLIVSGGSTSTKPVIKNVSRIALENGNVVEVNQKDHDYISIVGCGHRTLGEDIRIVAIQSLTELSQGQVGEIWVSSLSVAQGYWNRQEETRESFYAYLTDTGEGPFLRTGDLGFIENDELFITGRLKDLIIIRGHNHYPQDIEITVEQSHPALRLGGGAAFTVEIGEDEQLVIAHELQQNYQKTDHDAIAATIRRAVAERHDVHVHTVLLLQAGIIPKTSSGKIQRHACRKEFLSGTLSVIESNTEEMPSSELDEGGFAGETVNRETILSTTGKIRRQLLESYLQHQVAKVLRVHPSQLDHQQPLNNFGIDSLMAIELKHDIESTLGVTLSIVDLLSGISISHISSEILRQFTNPPIEATPDISLLREKSTYSPLSYGQRALWFIHQLAPENTAYIISVAARIGPDLNVQALQRALQKLVGRHPSLRTRFSTIDGEPVQHIYEIEDGRLEIIDAIAWSDAFVKDFLVKEAYLPFDLTKDALLRVKLLKLAGQEYILLLVVHHIVTDLWSMAIFLDELTSLYSAEKNGTRTSLSPLEIQYTDFVKWQTKMLASAEGEQHWLYWKAQLSGDLPVLDFPYDKHRPLVQTYSGSSCFFRLSDELSDRLKAFARAKGVTLYMALLAAFQVLLYRYTGQDDILIGSPTSGRSQTKLTDVVGYFVNPIVLRADLSGRPTFDEYLNRVKTTVLAGLEHQDFPFTLLVERLWLKRDASRSPLFQVMFTLQKPQRLADKGLTSFIHGEFKSQMNLGDLSLESVIIEQRASQFDLTLTMTNLDKNFAGSFQYNTDLFSATTISLMSEHFESLLESIVRDPLQPISILPLLTKAEKHKLLIEWNATRANYPVDECVHQLFEAQVERTPESIAIIFQEKQLSYRELNQRANQVAHYLQSLDVGPETRVGLFVEPSLEMMVGLLGILKAGGAYVPLAIDYPKKRLLFMLDNAQVSIVLTQEQLKADLPVHRAKVVCLDTEWNILANESDQNPTSEVIVDNLSHIIFTSGSTGRPKGVMVHHRSVTNLWTAITKSIYSQIGSQKLQIGLIAPLSFDGSIREYLLLLGGHTIHILPKEYRIAGDILLAYMKNHAIDEFYCTPSQLKLLISAGLLDGIGSVPSLVLLGGEPIGDNLWQLLTQSTSSTFYNIYGPTECTVDATLCCIRAPQIVPSIGLPIANTRIYILDSELQPVPIGVVGQLFIGGVGLARGYVNRPDLTADRFIPDPFSNEPGARVYRTGDLARYHPDGNIEFLGRIDYQVKVRGFTIELGEIETALTIHPNVRESVVIVQEDIDKRLVAYVIARKNPPPSASELRNYLKEYLPDYMIPSAFVELSVFPLTNNGKVDRQALPKVDRLRPELNTFLLAPSTPMEQKLTDIWASVLEFDQVGVNDNFFELGGTSLSILRVQALVLERIEIEIPVAKLFQYPTIRLLANFLDNSKTEHLPHLARSRLIANKRKQRFGKSDNGSEQR